jgi:WD40 repeat protein
LPARLWDVVSGRELRRFVAPGEHFTWCGDLSADGKVLATSADDGVVFWDTATGKSRTGESKRRIPPSMVHALRFAPDGKSVATIGGDWVRFWDVATARETRRLALPNKPKRETGYSLIGARLAFSPDGRTLAASSTRDGLIFLVDAASGRELHRLDGPEHQFKALAFSPDGKVLATGIDAGRRGQAIRLWDWPRRKRSSASRRIVPISGPWRSPPTAGGSSRRARTARPWSGMSPR